jgi:hypothetical protein
MRGQTTRSKPEPVSKPPRKPPARPKVVRRRKLSASAPKTAPKTDATKKSRITSVVETKGGNYPEYEKKSAKAKSFRLAFDAARKKKLKVFPWEGRKYTTKLAKKEGKK